MTNRENMCMEWALNVVPEYSVPETLFPHQIDAMASLKEGNHVFLGVPTGSGKTLPQLATILTMPGANFLTNKEPLLLITLLSGLAIVIPPLQD